VVRINGCDTPHFERDINDLIESGARSLMLPKSSAATLAHTRLRIATIERRFALERGCVRLFALAETASGIAQLPQLLNESTPLEALCFGNVDFSLDLGLLDGDLSVGAVYHARCSLAITAAALGVPAIDGVCLAIDEGDTFESEARAALGLGFTGKLCIHPAQVAIANDVFTPTSKEIADARRLVEAFSMAQQDGQGAFALDGKMVDAPVLQLQQRLLERARLAGVVDDGTRATRSGSREDGGT
jgi:citrate lyase subunit beta/citryl-CoA lyase